MSWQKNSQYPNSNNQNLNLSTPSLSTHQQPHHQPIKAHQDPRKLIKASYECLKKVVELDTQSTISDVTILESMNTSNAIVYRDFEYYFNKLYEDTKVLQTQIDVINSQVGDLDQIDHKVDRLIRLAEQLDEWSLELEVKSRKYKLGK